jgi:hypothetical protein
MSRPTITCIVGVIGQVTPAFQPFSMHLAGRPGLRRIGPQTLRLSQTGSRRVHSDINTAAKPSHPIVRTWGDVGIRMS